MSVKKETSNVIECTLAFIFFLFWPSGIFSELLWISWTGIL